MLLLTNKKDQEDRDNNTSAVATLEKPKVKKPPLYRVILHNDDYTPMELVVISLVAFFHRSNEDAFKIMMHVHEKGKGIAQGGLSREIAETKCNRVVQWFREQGYPLLATFESEE